MRIWVIKIYKIKHIGIRITVYFILIVLLIGVSISVSISLVFSSEVVKQINNVVDQKMGLIVSILDKNISDIQNLHFKIMANDSIKTILSSENFYIKPSSESINKLSRELTQYKREKTSIISIFFADMDKQILDPLYSKAPYSKIINNNNEFNEFVKNNYFGRFSTPSTFPLEYLNPKEEEKGTITYFGQYFNNHEYKQEGYVVINIRKESLFQDIKNICENTFDAAYIVDKNGQLIYELGNLRFNPQFIQKTFADHKNKFEKIDGQNFLVFNESIANYPEWRVIGLIPYKKVAGEVGKLYNIVSVIAVIFIILVVIISFYMSKKITGPILVVNKAMQQFEIGEWPEEVKVKSEDELKSLVSGFNRMVKNFKVLTEDIYREQEEKKKIEVAVVKYQLEILQSQINPHFIHNTLNTVTYMALKIGAHDISQMIQSFNMLLRASMTTGVEFVTISEELGYLAGYLNIQRFRYDNIFNYISDIEEDVKLCKIPKLILQPLVENSLYHGIIPKNSNGTIKVECKRSNDTVEIKVIDDGVGIRKSLLRDIANGQKTKSSKGFNNIGISNINGRLKLYYGKECTIKIYSDLGIGTCITFKIPYIE